MNLENLFFKLNAFHPYSSDDLRSNFIKYLSPMITAKGLTKRYGALQVLKGIDLTIEQGEVVSIVGASGAGKQPYSRFWAPLIVLMKVAFN